MPAPPVHLPRSRRAVRTVLARAAVAVAVGVTVLLAVRRSPAGPAVVVDDLSQLAAALFAAATCASSAWRSTGRRRRAWTVLAVGCGSWSAGQAIWSWDELVLGHETPFPSVADVGFLGFPLAVTAALLLYPTGARGGRGRRLLDGLIVAASLSLASWSTALGAVVSSDEADPLASVVGIAYPAADVVVLTMVVLLLGRATSERRALTLVGSGIAAIALADSAFLYLTAVGTYDSDSYLVSLGWCAGFVLVGLGGRSPVPGRRTTAPEIVRPSSFATFLPYLPLVGAVMLPGLDAVTGTTTRPAQSALTVALVLFVLVRQFTLLRDHGHLVLELAASGHSLRHAASHDGLTGLVNRSLFLERVRESLERHAQHDAPVAVLFCDLDDFKLVNDTLGHAAGDALLVHVAERLRSTLRSTDVLARLGGDEFAVLLGEGDAGAVGGAMVDALGEPLLLGTRVLSVGVSVGIATVPAGVPTPPADVLLARADTAMYAAKRGGKGSLRTFEPGMALAEVAEADLSAALARAVHAGELEVVFQPVVQLPTGRAIGAEALARWTHAGRAVPPTEFIPLAERTGLIGPLTDLVLERVCAQAAQWSADASGRPPRLGLNLSPLSVVDRGLPGRIAAALDRHGLSGDRLAVEVTESGVLTDTDAALEVCGALRALGVHLALDDFGVGFSSLAHLRLLPLDGVKLDRSLLEGVGRDDDATHFLRAVLRLGHDLGLSVVAEGVEHPEQLQILAELGCELVQGCLLGPPSPPSVLAPLLQGTFLPSATTPRPREGESAVGALSA